MFIKRKKEIKTIIQLFFILFLFLYPILLEFNPKKNSNTSWKRVSNIIALGNAGYCILSVETLDPYFYVYLMNQNIKHSRASVS